MSCETIAEIYQTTGVIPAAPWRVRLLNVLSDWRLTVTFNDGVSGIVDISALVFGLETGIFGALRDPTYFATAYLDCGAVTWSNGADLAPDAMYKEIRLSGVCKILD